MPTIREQIQAIAAEVPINFEYGTKYDNNISGDSTALPVCFMLEPDELGFYVKQGGGMDDFDLVHLQFLTKCTIEETADSRAAKIDLMRYYAKQMVNRIITADGLQVSFTNGSLRVGGFVRYDYLDVNLTGIEISISLRNLRTEGVCL
jgi:hypothetical protein